MKTNAGASTGTRAIYDLNTFDLTVGYTGCDLIFTANLVISSLVFFDPERTTRFLMEVVGRSKITRNPDQITFIGPSGKIAWIVEAVSRQVLGCDRNRGIFPVPRIAIVNSQKTLKIEFFRVFL